MKDHVTVTGQSQSVLQIMINEQAMFEETLLQQAAFDPSCLACRVISRDPVVLEYDTGGLTNIRSFLKEYTFVHREGYRFLESLLETAISSARAKPLWLDIDRVFCSCHGDGFRFVMLPLKMDAWLLQREEMREFICSVREAFHTTTDYEIPGWLQMAQASENFSLPMVVQGLRDLERSFHPRRFPFFPEKPKEPFRTAEEVIIPVLEYPGPNPVPSIPLPAAARDKEQGSSRRESVCEKTQVLAPVPDKQAVLQDQDTEYELRFETMTLGRGIQADIRLVHESVSALHAKITSNQGRFYIQDMKSANGTWLEEKRVIRRMRLKNGMHLRLGAVTLIFRQ